MVERKTRRRRAPQRGPWVVGIALRPSGAVEARAGTVHVLCAAIGIHAGEELMGSLRPFDTKAEAAGVARAINEAVSGLYFPPSDAPGPEGGA